MSIKGFSFSKFLICFLVLFSLGFSEEYNNESNYLRISKYNLNKVKNFCNFMESRGLEDADYTHTLRIIEHVLKNVDPLSCNQELAYVYRLYKEAADITFSDIVFHGLNRSPREKLKTYRAAMAFWEYIVYQEKTTTEQ